MPAPTITAAEVQRFREETPGVAHRIHMNNAGAGLMPRPVLRAITEHLELESRIGGYEAAEAASDDIARAYTATAALLGAEDRNLAFVENATAAFAQALSTIPFEAGDTILTTQDDYISNQLAFLSMTKRLGVRVVRAPALPEGGVNPDAMASLMDTHRPKLVSVTHVPTGSGLVQAIEPIGAACRSREIPYLVDACQSLGQLPLDVETIGCDFLTATCRKFLRGPRGAGMLYVADRVLESPLHPLFIDMRGAEWTAPDAYEISKSAGRFENWEFAYALVVGAGRATEYAAAIGIDRIAERNGHLVTRLRAGLEAIDGVRVLDRGRNRSAIVTAHVRGWNPERLKTACAARDINVDISWRSYSVIDFGEKGVDWALRLSPHYYCTEQEIETVLGAMTELAARPESG